MWFDVWVVSSLAACAAPNWGVASLRRVLCGWPALVGWRFLCVCLRHCLCINKPILGVQAWPGPALPCLAVFLGAGELPRRLVFSCVCAGMVPVAPSVGAVLVCACGPGGRRCGLSSVLQRDSVVWFDVCVVSSLAACIAPRLGSCFLAPRAMWLAYVGRLTFLVVCAFDGFLLWVWIAYDAQLLRLFVTHPWFPALGSDCLCINYCVSL